jgi:hypothetical protein
MTINLNDTNNLNWAETSYDVSKLKSNKLMLDIVQQKNETGQNFMIVPMSIYNLLETNSAFIYSTLESLKSNVDDETLRHVGSIYGIEIYLDLFSPSDTILLKYDKSVMRDNKIDAILNNNKLKEDIEITVLNY